MHWELSEEQDLFVASLREWLQERADSSTVRGWLDTGDHTHFERLFLEEGWAGVGFDESVGGQGGGVLELALTARELGRAAAPSAGWLQSAIVVPALADEADLLRAAMESGEVTALAVRADRVPAATSVQSSGDQLRGQIPCVLGATRARRFVFPPVTATRRSCGWWTARPGVWGFTPGRCWIDPGTSPISPSMMSRHADWMSTPTPRSAK